MAKHFHVELNGIEENIPGVGGHHLKSIFVMLSNMQVVKWSSFLSSILSVA